MFNKRSKSSSKRFNMSPVKATKQKNGSNVFASIFIYKAS